MVRARTLPAVLTGRVDPTPYLRIPAILSALLLAVFFPVILGLGSATELSASGIAELTSLTAAQQLALLDEVDAFASRVDVLLVDTAAGITPTALSTAPLATQSKTPLVVMAAATSSITEASPYIIRTSFTLPQVTIGIADWAAKNKSKRPG